MLADLGSRHEIRVTRAADAARAQDWRAYHAEMAMSYFDPEGLDVLVVGCGQGEDGIPFVENGAASVTGLDKRENIGANYIHPRVTYVRHRAERAPFPSGRFGLVFSVATLEHIADIEAVYREMARVLAPGGGVYCVAAPLWHVRCGPHWGDALNDVPWAHLRFPLEAQVRLAVQRGLEETFVRQLLGGYCNGRRAKDYVAACADLGLEIIHNEVGLEEETDADIAAQLYAEGYSREDLFGMSHTLIATKPG